MHRWILGLLRVEGYVSSSFTSQPVSVVAMVAWEVLTLPDSNTNRNKDDSDKRQTVGGAAARFLRSYGLWAAVLIPFLIHMVLAVQHIRLGYHAVVPEFAEFSGSGIMEWLRAYGMLFMRPETQLTLSRMYALWVIVFMSLSVYPALRGRENIMDGVLQFITHSLAVILILSVLLPTVWILMAGWGPAMVELIPPVVFLFMGFLLTQNVRNISKQNTQQ